MENMLTCGDCHQSFHWLTPFKKFCPSCKEKRRIEQHKKSDAKYRLSPKGIASYQRDLEKMRKHPKRQPTFCSECGKQLRDRASVRCRTCFLIFLRSQTMEKHPNWKGGIQKTSGGYTYIKVLNHPGADYKGRVSEHRLIWEKINNKLLPTGWIIHHLNGIKSDNRPSNLIALPNKKHYLILQAKAKRIQELEATLKQQGQLI